MKNYLEALQHKRAAMEYYYARAQAVSHMLNQEHAPIVINEFCSMMEAVRSCLHIARTMADKQSPVEMRAFMKTIDDRTIEELSYIEQFVMANRVDYVFTVTDRDRLDISIKPIVRRNRQGYFDERKVIPYMQEVKRIAETMIDEFLCIYYESSFHYDQSWRSIDVHRSSFTCKECGSIVTGIGGHLGNLSGISLQEKESYLPRKSYVYGHEVIKADLLPWGGVNEIAEDEVLIPIDSLYMDARRAPAPGCCGPDSSTFNVTCKNGHSVGREAADCYMPHFIRLPLDRVSRVEVLDD
ncbi:hypothetical protein MO973_00460 [Paenibacillus sp. TRM 82003]|nr:hypothetical protein [Paenibacillus sp. TRM 82003]